MKKRILSFIVVLFASASVQSQKVNKVRFFEDTTIIHSTVSADMVSIYKNYGTKGYKAPAFLSCKMKDGSTLEDSVELEIRGNFRREYCHIPPLKINFRYDTAAAFAPLKKLKLVSKCKSFSDNDQYLAMEYLVYKMYNLLTDKSFRVRLLHLHLNDEEKSKRDVSTYAFLIEDATDLAKRNGCKERTQGKFQQESTDRYQTTILSIFEYMIGNTDWSTYARHNICLIGDAQKPNSLPYAVPYDFDFSGLVGTTYSVPDEKLGIDDVRERLYRGFARTPEEINLVVEIFKAKERAIYQLIEECPILSNSSKKYMTNYLQPFFDTIKDPARTKMAFIDNARVH